MTEQTFAGFAVGDRIPVTITKTAPFGVLVEAADGTAGLVTGAVTGAQGDSVTVTVETIDTEKRRFSAVAAH